MVRYQNFYREKILINFKLDIFKLITNFKLQILNSENRGFTIIELIISIFILSIAVVGIFSAFSIMTILTSDSTDRLIATYLAQEGMEIIRNIRDTNWLNIDAGSPVDATWVDYLSCASGCEVDYRTTGSDSNPVLKRTGNYLNIDQSGYGQSGYDFYNYAGGTPTKFKRKIIITCLPNNNCATDYIMKVAVQVSWNKKATILNFGVPADTADTCGAYNCITIEEMLYDWY